MTKYAPTQDTANASHSTQVTKTNAEPSSAPNPAKDDPDTTTPIHFPSALKHLPCGPSRETDSVDGLVTRFQKVKLRPPTPPPPPPPEINAKLDGARRECDVDDCSRKSAPNFDGHTFYCHGHGYKIQKEWRYQCVGTKKRSIERCNNYSYRILHTDVDEPMAKDYAYSPQIEKRIREVIQNFAKVLGASAENHDDYLRHLDIHKVDDANQIRELYYRYRDHVAEGVVYFLAFKNTSEDIPGKLLVKIGYSTRLEERLKEYTRCSIHCKSNGMFAHLLERIFQTVLEQRQYDYLCKCDTNQGDIFRFDPVHGINDEFAAAKCRVMDLKEQFEKWAEIVMGLESLHKEVILIHGPLLTRIEKMFKVANIRLY
ncbi:hypothetical protein BGZ74_007117 [Mortierella antarctica]|nr:hypothetical protein BGZ74_007117 [Mortierella antarctica]